MPYTPAGNRGPEERIADPAVSAAQIRRSVQALQGVRTGRIRPGQVINVDYENLDPLIIQRYADLYSRYASTTSVQADVAQYADFISFHEALGTTTEVGFWSREGTLYRFLDNTMEKIGTFLDDRVEKIENSFIKVFDWLNSTYEEKCQICDRGGELTCDGCGMTICTAEVRHITDELDFCEVCSLNWEGKE